MYASTTIVGNLGRDPELRYTPSGDPVCGFSVAVTRKWTGKDGTPQEQTTWYAVSAFGNQAEPCSKYLTKGRQVLVEGDVTARAYMGKDGEPKAGLELRARVVRFLGTRQDGDGGGNGSVTPHLDEALGVRREPQAPLAGRVVKLNADDPGDLPF